MNDQPEPAVKPSRQDLLEQLESAHQRLAEAHKMASIGRLSAGIVHEINTPIGSIFSNNEVILRSLEVLKKLLAESCAASVAPSQEAMEIIETMATLAAVDKIACERISGVIRSLKTFSRVDDRDIRKACLEGIIRNTLKLTGTIFRRRIAVETHFEELPEIECYPGLLNQVFANLLVNAGQAIEGEGKITVTTRRENDFVHVSIADTGKGIKPEDRGRIFARGFTTKPIGEGTGLGLAITREIVEDTHGGSIDFESEPGMGTTFHVRLPITQTRKSSPAS
ncbi:MAG: hypothetical protein HUU41_18315 [Bryobacteraceae bacterium]|nr:hypothetical protein [Bryobacterales bacterium]MEB2361683.1 ATP-binding protein [Bryobacterales bacterium]NUN03064.1 hypothetical protein [Bryobacteraceae bacterium]